MKVINFKQTQRDIKSLVHKSFKTFCEFKLHIGGII
jgi:hypothetical protein